MAFLNQFTLKKWAAFMLVGFLSILGFVLASQKYGFLIGVGVYCICLLVSVLAAFKIIANPFTDMLEGQGVLLLNIDSTGVIRPTIVKIESPYMRGKLGNRAIEDVFDRDSVMQIAVPEKAAEPATVENGELVIRLNNQSYNDGRFALFHYPVLIYNQQIGSIITKGFLAQNEHEAFAKHIILYVSRKLEEVNSNLRDFGRYIIENLNPSKKSIFSNWVFWVVIALVVVLVIMFAPAVINSMKGFMGSASGAVSQAAGNVGGGTIKLT